MLQYIPVQLRTIRVSKPLKILCRFPKSQAVPLTDRKMLLRDSRKRKFDPPKKRNKTHVSTSGNQHGKCNPTRLAYHLRKSDETWGSHLPQMCTCLELSPIVLLVLIQSFFTRVISLLSLSLSEYRYAYLLQFDMNFRFVYHFELSRNITIYLGMVCTRKVANSLIQKQLYRILFPPRRYILLLTIHR